MSLSTDGSNACQRRIFRFAAFAACTACISVAIVKNSISPSLIESSIHEQRAPTSRNLHTTATGTESVYTQKKFHQSGMGGIHNINHPAGAKARRHLSSAPVHIPQSANPHATPSLERENIENLRGHYVHDEHRSPFASFLYDRPKEVLEAEQADYIERMAKVREEWGAWDFRDEHPEIRPIADLEKVPYRDMKNGDFPEKAWQMDEKYVKDFIAEARKLVDRVREGIYSEYGHPKTDNEEEMKQRDASFAITVDEAANGSTNRGGWAAINKRGLDAYARKLLHAMITNDEFYYIMGGHSAAAGHGNNFHQVYMMEHANIMEPVLHKLGVRLITRNLAMGGLGTIHYSLGAKTLYGEADVMMWDSSMTEKGGADQDLFHKQVMMGGERFPVLIGGWPGNLEAETGGNLWYANIMNGHSGVPVVTSLDQAKTLPWAAQEFVCASEVKDLCNRGLLDRCWVDRSDFTPPTAQAGHVGGKASWHPGYRTHKLAGRKQSMLMLKALDVALDMWEAGIEEKGFPLHEDYWHVGTIYDTARSNLIAYVNGEGLGKTQCEERWKPRFGLDRACRQSMSGMTTWTPKNRPNGNGLLAYLKAAPNGYKPGFEEDALYDGVDVLPPGWKVPAGEIDVHAIAIASTYAAPELDHSWTDNKDADAEEAENSRRMLRKAARELIAPSTKRNVGAIHDGNVSVPRNLYGDEVVPGQGWYFSNEVKVSPGYCDGSPVSWCKRTKGNNCLLYGHNDGRAYLLGDGLSGWLIFTLPSMKEGLVFGRIEAWRNGSGTPRTTGWTTENNSTQDGGRNLKWKPPPQPQDSFIDIAANGKIIKTYNRSDFFQWGAEMNHNEAFFPIMDDKDFVKGDEAETVEIGIRLRSESDPRTLGIGISHIYWA